MNPNIQLYHYFIFFLLRLKGINGALPLQHILLQGRIWDQLEYDSLLSSTTSLLLQCIFDPNVSDQQLNMYNFIFQRYFFIYYIFMHAEKIWFPLHICFTSFQLTTGKHIIPLLLWLHFWVIIQVKLVKYKWDVVSDTL